MRGIGALIGKPLDIMTNTQQKSKTILKEEQPYNACNNNNNILIIIIVKLIKVLINF